MRPQPTLCKKEHHVGSCDQSPRKPAILALTPYVTVHIDVLHVRGLQRVTAMNARQLSLYIGYRLTKPLTPDAPPELRFAVRKRPLLHPIQLIKPINVGDNFLDQSWKTVVRQHRALEFFRQTRSGLRHRRYGYASENIVQKFELEPASYRLGNDRDACARQERRGIGHESVEACRPTTGLQRGDERLRSISDDIQFNSVFLENRICDLDKAGEVFLLHHPLERSHDDHSPGCCRSDAPLARDPSREARRERQRAILVQTSAQGQSVLVGNRRQQIHIAHDPALESAHLVCVAPERQPFERRSTGLASHRAPQYFFVIVRYVHEDRPVP